ncbi:HsmA family protein [Saccharicrinis aurantiacus]|uniref:HsmA family protein n=1 Tax=Saccharicrinis aurantiacus TaxID=1849719 RepID=UPI000837EC61|nr:HsmA family protein [Saccharicrinis aurantiacus]
MSLALLFYTVGVWAEKISGKLKLWHLACFICGLILDSIGTSIMFSYTDGISYSFHAIIGFCAIGLMLIHAIWALIVLLSKDEKRIKNFHHFSISVWGIWLIPYLGPVLMHLF